jgi:hypothetical protein
LGKSWRWEFWTEIFHLRGNFWGGPGAAFLNWLVWRVVLLLRHAGQHYNREGGSERIAAMLRVWG